MADMTPEAVFKKYQPAVVRIEVALHGASLGVGSGFFLTNSGEIATSLHVIRAFLVHPETDITIKLSDGKIFKTAKVGACSDARGVDLCILKIDHVPKAILPVANVEVTPGESIVAIGHPRGLDFSISTGIVSALRSHPAGWSEVQIDAAISPGNSGGPIINRRGQAIGVVYQFERDGQNLNFGILTPEIDRLRNLELPFLSPADARKDFLERSKRLARKSADQWAKPAIRNLAEGKSRPPGLKWMRALLGTSSFLMLLPDLFQTCERSDDSETNATSCSSTGGDLVVTVQKRPRSLEGSLLAYRGKKLVESRTLSIVERLEAEGTWENSRGSRAAFMSRPGSARCYPILKHGILSSDETTQVTLRKKSYFQDATAVCRFETENDSEPGALSVSQWIEVGGEFYGINIWAADPGRLAMLHGLSDLILASAGATGDDPRLLYRAALRPSLKRETSSRASAIGGADFAESFSDDTSTVTIARTAAVPRSMMARQFLKWAGGVAKTADPKISSLEVAGNSARIGTWIIANPKDRQKSALLMMTARFGSRESWVLYEIQPLPSMAQANRVPSKSISSDIERFKTWTQEFQPPKED